MLIFITKIVFIFLLTTSAILFYESAHKMPPRSTKSKLEYQAVTKRSLAEKFLTVVVMPIEKTIQPFVKLPREMEIKLKGNLDRAEIGFTPEEYYARAIAISLISIPVPVFAFICDMRAIAFLMLAVPIVLFFHFTSTYKDVLDKKKERINFALPSFIRAILYKLNTDTDGKVISADLISIFEDYHRIAPKVFAYDIEKLIFEMKSKDIETGLSNFSNRLNIPEVNVLTDALIGVTRGEKQTDVLSSLAREMDTKLNEIRKRELEKRPSQVMVASIPLFVMAIIAIMYVFINAMVTGINVMM